MQRGASFAWNMSIAFSEMQLLLLNEHKNLNCLHISMLTDLFDKCVSISCRLSWNNGRQMSLLLLMKHIS